MSINELKIEVLEAQQARIAHLERQLREERMLGDRLATAADRFETDGGVGCGSDDLDALSEALTAHREARKETR